MPVLYGGTPVAEEEEKKRKPKPQVDLWDVKLAAAQEASRRTLPSDVVYGIAYASGTGKEAARAAATISRLGDVYSPKPELGKGQVRALVENELLDPLTGGPITMRRARALIEQTSVGTGIASMLQNLQTRGLYIPGVSRTIRVGADGRLFRERIKFDPATIAAYVDAMSIMPGKMPVGTAVNAAIMLAANKVNLSQFTRALDAINQWNGATRTITEAEQVGLAQWWAENRTRPMQKSDVGPLHDPVLRESAAELLASDYKSSGPGVGVSRAMAEQWQAIRDAQVAASENAAAYERNIAPVRAAVNELLADQEPGWIEKGVTALFGTTVNIATGTFWLIGNTLLGTPAYGGPSTENYKEMFRDSWDIYTGKEEMGKLYASAAGLTPGTTSYNVVSAGVEFLAYGYFGPDIFLGNMARGWRMGRMVLTEGARTTETLGLAGTIGYALRTRESGIPFLAGSRLGYVQQSITARSEQFIESQAGRVVEASLKNSEYAARMFKGAKGATGLDSKVTAYIARWTEKMYGGKATAAAVADAKEILRVSFGTKPASEVGRLFDMAMRADELRIVETAVNDAIRARVEEALATPIKGGTAAAGIGPKVMTAIAKGLKSDFRAMGLAESTYKPIIQNFLRTPITELAAVASLPQGAVLATSGLGLEGIQTASRAVAAHVEELTSQQNVLRGAMEFSTAAKWPTKLEQLVGQKEFESFVKPLLAEGRTVDEVTSAIVQHMVPGGILANIIQPGFKESMGTLVSAMGELRAVLGDQAATALTTGVRTLAELRTRLTQLVDNPFLLVRNAESRLFIRWSDGIASLEGGAKVYPKTSGWTQAAHEASLPIADSPLWKKRGAAWAASVWEKNPPAMVNIESFDAAEGLGRWLHQMNVAPAIRDSFVAKFRALQSSTLPSRQGAIEKLMTDIIEQGYRSIGIPEDGIRLIMARVRPHYSYASRMAQARTQLARIAGLEDVAGGAPLTSMLKNLWLLPSPREMELALRRGFGGLAKVRELSTKMFGHDDLFALGNDEWTRLVGAMGKVRAKWGPTVSEMAWLSDHARNTWTAWTLLRPGWALKVLPDENFRALVELHSYFDRLASVKFYAQALDKFGVRGREVVVPSAEGGTSTIHFVLPGMLEAEPAASMGVMHGTAMRSQAYRESVLAKQLDAALKPVIPGTRAYWETWSWTLSGRIDQNELGRSILKFLGKDISDGRPWDWARVRQFAVDNPRLWQPLRQPGETVDDVLLRARAFIEQSTADGNPGVVALALGGKATPNALKRVMNGAPPPILPVRELEEVMGMRASLLSSSKDFLFDHLMRKPSDYLNRNPLYHAIYSRELERTTQVLAESGRTFTKAEVAAIEAGTHPIAVAARTYALERELSTMFSYINNSRFSEASRHLFAFFSPYQEQYTVWGRLLMENPQIVGQVGRSMRLATDTGVVYKDEFGDWVVDADKFGIAMGVALMFHPTALAQMAVGLGAAVVADKLIGAPRTDWSIPISRLNLFTANELTVGGLGFPAPGFLPWVKYPVNVLLDMASDSDYPFKENLTDYFGTFGTDFSVVPGNWHNIIAGTTGTFDPELLTNTQNKMADALIVKGYNLTPENAEAFADRTLKMAKQWLIMRGVSGMLSATAPHILTEADRARDTLFSLMDSMPYDEALAEIRRLYPDSPDIELLAIGYSLWTQGGPSFPPTMEAGVILSDPRTAAAAKQYPEMAFFLVPEEFRNGEYDYNAASEQLATGMRELNPPIVMLGDQLIGGRAYDLFRRQGWDEYFAIQDGFARVLMAHGVMEGDTGYEGLKDLYLDKPLANLTAHNLPFANDYNLHDTTFTDLNLAKLRKLATLPVWRDTMMAKAILDYNKERDDIFGIMFKNNINGLQAAGEYTRDAVRLGLDVRWEGLLTDLEGRYGDTWNYLWNFWLKGDLQDVDTRGEKLVQRAVMAVMEPSTPVEQIESQAQSYLDDYLTPWEQEWRSTGDAIDAAKGDTEKSAAFLARARLSMKAMKIARETGINPQDLWWQGLKPTEKEEYQLRAAMRPYVFLSAFERRTELGFNTSAAVEKAFLVIAEAKLAVNEAIDNGADSADTWAQFDKWVKTEILPIKGMPREVERAHAFGYSLFKTLPGQWREGTEGEAWDAMQNAAENIRAAFLSTGSATADPYVSSADFRAVKVALEDYVREWADYSPEFKDHVEYLQDLSSDTLVALLMPELWWVTI